MSSELQREVGAMYVRLFDEALSSAGPRVSETQAQKAALGETFSHYLGRYPGRASEIWSALQVAHVRRKANIDFELTETQIAAVTSADQSWKSSSGHAAEEIFARALNEVLSQSNVKVRFPADVKQLADAGRLANAPQDCARLTTWVKAKVFDLYILSEGADIPPKVFGCLQVKTTIRDRVTRDREPSLVAMDEFFWSAALVINADHLGFPKYRAMVNGGASAYEFADPGWHGMYALDGIDTDDRIYAIDGEWQPFVGHALQARDQFLAERQWLDKTWHAE